MRTNAQTGKVIDEKACNIREYQKEGECIKLACRQYSTSFRDSRSDISEGRYCIDTAQFVWGHDASQNKFINSIVG